jgi:hypothetical protein
MQLFVVEDNTNTLVEGVTHKQGHKHNNGLTQRKQEAATI